MPNYLFEIIIIIFLIHFILFFRLSLLHRKSPYILATASFFLLIIYSSMRLWAPDMMLFSLHGYTYLRALAWVTTAMTLTAYIRGKAKRR